MRHKFSTKHNKYLREITINFPTHFCLNRNKCVARKKDDDLKFILVVIVI